jgi:hypothetical protein
VKIRTLKYLTLFLIICVVDEFAAAQNPLANGGYLVLNGARFKNDTIKFATVNAEAKWVQASYADSMSHTEIAMSSVFDGSRFQLRLLYPGMLGSFQLMPAKNKNERYSNGIYIVLNDKKIYGDGMQAQLKKTTVNITHYDPVGGIVTGSAEGTLYYLSSDSFHEMDIDFFLKFSVQRKDNIIRN